MDDKKLPKDEQFIAGWARGVIFLVVIFFIYFGYLHKPTFVDDPFVNDNLWDALHPTSFINAIGLIFIGIFLFYLSGFWRKIIGTQLLPVGSSWPNYVGFAVGVLGFILIWI